MKFLKYVFSPNLDKYEGVRPINIYLLRILNFLMFALMSIDAWKVVFFHEGQLEKYRAMAICVWAAYGTLGFFGLFKPLKWLPIVLFMIFYKTLWLIVVSLPLWKTNQLEGSPAEELTYIFIAAPFMLLIIPWKYVFQNYLFWTKSVIK